MSSLLRILTSSVGKKFVMAITGLAWVFFLITHLLGNLALYRADGSHYNRYSHTLVSLGWILWVAEIGLVVLLVGHVVTAVRLKMLNRSARPTNYVAIGTKGGPSKKNLSSMTMIFTGLFLLGFIVWHVLQFKFGPSIEQGYTAVVDGQEMRDLHRLVIEVFHNPIWVVFYVFGMVLMGLHIRHGFFSAFQTIGVAGNKISRTTQRLGVILALVLSVGFLFIPIWIFFEMSGRLS